MITFSVFQFIICLVLGMGPGLCGGLLGSGGGLISIPVLRSLFDMPQSGAQGMALIMIIPNGLLIFIQYKWHKKSIISRLCYCALSPALLPF